MNQLPRFKRGQQLTANELNTLVDAINARTILPSAGVLVRQTTNGVTLSATPERGGAASATVKPFELSVVMDGTTPKIRVVPSTLAGGTSLDIMESESSTTPIFSAGDVTPCLLTPVVSGSAGFVQGGVKVDDEGNVTKRWIETVDAVGTDVHDADPTVHYVELGSVAYDSGTDTYTVANTRYGPVDASICRNWFSYDPVTYGVTFSA